MLNDMTWRKTPRDLIINPKIRFIAGHTAAHLKQAVFAFYAAIYMQADNDGVIDLGDTEVLADIVMLDDPDDISTLIDAFVKRGFIERVYPDDAERASIYFLTDWDNPAMATWNGQKRVEESQETRVARIRGEKKSRGTRKKSEPAEPEPPAPQHSDVNNPSHDSDIAALAAAAAGVDPIFAQPADKIDDTECAQKSTLGSKPVGDNGTMITQSDESVTPSDRKSIFTEKKEKIREEREERAEKKENTHTQNSACAGSASASPQSGFAAAPASRSETEIGDAETKELADERAGESPPEQDESTERQEHAEISESTEPKEGAETTQNQSVQGDSETKWTYEDAREALKEWQIPEPVAKRMTSLETYEQWRAAAVFYAFFKKYAPLPFDRDEIQIDAIQAAALDCELLKEPKNPLYVIANMLCTAFLDLITCGGAMTEKNEYFRGMPCLPQNLFHNSVRLRIFDAAKKKLSPGKKAGEEWLKEIERCRKDMQEHPEKYNGPSFFEAECTKRGIDPHGKGAMKRLMQAFGTEQEGKKADNTS